MKLNLGCGHKRLEGYANVDKCGNPDILFDLETFPWPWRDDTVEEVQLIEVLEHLGQNPDIFIGIMKELYRVCKADARIHISVPHPRHEFFLGDPTHVRPITAMVLKLFSKKENMRTIALGAANTTLALYHGVDFEVESAAYSMDSMWRKKYAHLSEGDLNKKFAECAEWHNNVVCGCRFVLKVVK